MNSNEENVCIVYNSRLNLQVKTKEKKVWKEWEFQIKGSKDLKPISNTRKPL